MTLPGALIRRVGDGMLLGQQTLERIWPVGFLGWLTIPGLLVLLVLRLLVLGLDRGQWALPVSIAVATGVSLIVNDSPLDVVAIGIVGYLAAQAYVLAEAGSASEQLAGVRYRRVET